MLILLDHSTPAPLRYELKGHEVVETVERGWERLANGALLDAAEAAGFELSVNADKNIRYHQNLTGRKISIVVLGKAQWTVVHITSGGSKPAAVGCGGSASTSPAKSGFAAKKALKQHLLFVTLVGQVFAQIQTLRSPHCYRRGRDRRLADQFMAKKRGGTERCAMD